MQTSTMSIEAIEANHAMSEAPVLAGRPNASARQPSQGACTRAARTIKPPSTKLEVLRGKAVQMLRFLPESAPGRPITYPSDRRYTRAQPPSGSGHGFGAHMARCLRATSSKRSLQGP